MRRIFAILLCAAGSAVTLSQTSSSPQSTTTQTTTTPKSSTAAKPSAGSKTPVHHTAAPAAQPTAIIETTVGTMTCTLFPDKAPLGVQNFIGLATGTKDWRSPSNGTTKHNIPLYDGTIFHRVIPGFMIQGGDPAGTGSGADPVQKFKNEVSSDLVFDRPGRMAYANAGPDTNSSQFFITEVATPHLNGKYTLFGQCDDAAVTLVKQIARVATDPSNDRPFRPVKIVHVKIVRGSSATTTKPKPAAPKKPAAVTTPKSTTTSPN
jgi:peptidyl-prolyl cis-trans isomerase A (cyclophilin A)